MKNIICDKFNTFIGVQHIPYNKQTTALAFKTEQILSTVTHGNANDIAAIVMAIKQTRKEIEKIFKNGINSDAALITNNKSVLYNKSFEDLQSF